MRRLAALVLLLAIPPSGPSEVIVSVEPDSSAEVTLPVRAASASRRLAPALAQC